MDRSALINYLRQRGLISEGPIRLTPLAGGVSSDILLVEGDHERFVLKSSLEKLRVKDDWYCNTARNVTEYEAIGYAQTLFPESVPQILHADREQRLFVMEYLGDQYTPWKQQLLMGSIDQQVAERVAILLAKLHSSSWLAKQVQQRFDTADDFFALRIEPYLLTTGQRHTCLQQIFQDEANRLRHSALALVHGDWSAKNMLVSRDRLVVLDWEVAWFGDPAFDSAFFLNLLYLKSLFNRRQISEYMDMMQTFRRTYRSQMKFFDADLSRRIVRLTLMLMLARIDGKSPVEYITTDEDKNVVRCFVRQALMEAVDDEDELDRRWRKALEAP
jgi:5-methylthioribose kinase